MIIIVIVFIVMLTWYSTGWLVYSDVYAIWKGVLKNIEKVRFIGRESDHFQFNVYSGDNIVVAKICLYDSGTLYINDEVCGEQYIGPDTYFLFTRKIKKTLLSMVPEEYKTKPNKKEVTFLDYL